MFAIKIINTLLNLFRKDKYEVLVVSTEEITFGFKLSLEWKIKCYLTIENFDELLEKLEGNDSIIEYDIQAFGPGSDDMPGTNDLKASAEKILVNLQSKFSTDK